jgi:hypothetical protein
MRAFLLLFLALLGQAGAGELMRSVQQPTAGIVAPRTYYFALSTFPPDGLRFEVQAGVVPRLMAGLSFGGSYLIGLEDPVWFDRVGVKARFRFLDESVEFPAFALGFDNEQEPSRAAGDYTRLSRGVYLVASKNFMAPGGDLGVHGGVSISFDDSDHADFWLGADKSLPMGFGIAADWDAATNEADSVRFDTTGGFLNFELFWESFGQVRIAVQLKDVLETGGEPYRSLAVDFLGLF